MRLTNDQRADIQRMLGEGMTPSEIAYAMRTVTSEQVRGVQLQMTRPPRPPKPPKERAIFAEDDAEEVLSVRGQDPPAYDGKTGRKVDGEEWRRRFNQAKAEADLLRGEIGDLRDALAVAERRKKYEWLGRVTAIPRNCRGREITLRIDDSTDELRWILAVRGGQETLEQRSFPLGAADAMVELVCNALLPVTAISATQVGGLR